METKFCAGCNSNVDVVLFTKRKASSDGLDRLCKPCKSKYKKEFYENNKTRLSEERKTFRSENKKHMQEQSKRNYEKNKGNWIERVKEWQSNNVDLVKSYKVKNFEANKEEYFKRANERYHTEVGKEMHKARVYKYSQTEKGKLTNVSKRNKRKHIMNGTENSFTKEDWINCLTHFDNSCAYCGCQTKLSQDHVIPVSKLGSYTIDNVVPSCKPCNSSKSNSDLIEWYKTKPYYTDERYNKITNYIETLQKGVI